MMKKNTFKKMLFVLLMTTCFFGYSQQLKQINQVNVNIENDVELTEDNKRYLEEYGVVRCATVENEELLRRQYPNRPTTAEFEARLAPIVAKIKADRLAGKAPQVVYNIPVVVHIMHNGEAIGTAPNITDAQAISQIDVFNQDFRRMMGTPGGANSTGLAVDVEINFCLAQTDPMGNLTSGINRINMGQDGINAASNGAALAAFDLIKPASQWDPTEYMNMWSVKFTGGAASLLGYAQFPDNTPNLGGINPVGGAADTDGVVAAYHTFGTADLDDGTFLLNAPYDRGRTMTHEVGHWLGLRHIWGDTAACSDDDFCADTPDSTTSNGGCPTVDNCPADGLGNDQVQNYMDYTNDTCMDTFTQDQKDRMQAIMAQSPRRMELNTSVTCQAPTPYISFAAASQTINESTDCTFTDVTMTMNIGKAPSANADVTVSGAGTATDGIDYQIIGGSLTFPTGSAADQTFTLRIFNDGFVEVDETLTLSMVVNANGGDAIATTAPTLNNAITLVSDNALPNPLTQTDIFTYVSDATGWTLINANGGAQYGIFNSGINLPGVMEPNFLGCQHLDATADDYIISPTFTIPADATGLSLSHALFSLNASQNYELWFTTDSSNTAGVLGGVLLSSGAATDYNAANVLANLNLDAFLPGIVGQTGSLVLRHVTSVASNNGYLLWDTMTLTASVSTSVQTAVNTGAPTQIPLASTGTIYKADGTSGNIMTDITNNNAVDYGCVSTSVSRASGGAQMYQVAGAVNFVTDKTFTITPATIQAAGNATVKFYFTETEIAAWEAATGSVRGDLMIIKDNGTTQTPVVATIGAFGTEVTLEGTFTTGVNGTYYFGRSSALSVKDNDFALFNIYPNPSNGNVNITLSSNEDVNVSLHDIRGRQVFVNSYNNNSATFIKTIDFSAVAPGVYLLYVESGAKKATKKIVIQ